MTDHLDPMEITSPEPEPIEIRIYDYEKVTGEREGVTLFPGDTMETRDGHDHIELKAGLPTRHRNLRINLNHIIIRYDSTAMYTPPNPHAKEVHGRPISITR